jgi:succinyl-CoA synthetase beta subunit
VAQKLEVLGLEVPEDLRAMALTEQEFKEHAFKVKNGIREDHQSTILLKEALDAGQRGKQGIGFKPAKNKKEMQEKNINEVFGQETGDLIGEYKDMIDTFKQKEYQLKYQALQGENQAVRKV